MIGTIITGTFNGFTNLESIEFKLPMVCLVTGCVSRRRDARQIIGKFQVFKDKKPIPPSSNSPQSLKIDYGLFNKGHPFDLPSVPTVLMVFMANPSIIIPLLEAIISTSL
jgi:hypothetical protein